MTERRQFPILNSGGCKVDWQFVEDHAGKQAMTNHGQTVQRLAERGGLSWEELYYAVKGERWPYTKKVVDRQGAISTIRAMETVYLSLTTPCPPPGYVLIPIEAMPTTIKAMAETIPVDDEGPMVAVCDIIDCAENKQRTILKAIYAAIVKEFTPI